MISRLAATVLGAILWCGISSCLAADDACNKSSYMVSDGSCWNTLSNIEKISIVEGIWMGNAGRTTADDLIGDAAGYYSQRDWMKIPDTTTIGDIVEYINLLYHTPANRKIEWTWAYILAAMNARDDDSDDRLALLSFLREHNSVPTSGNLVGVKGPDMITVLSDGQQFDVQLSGVSGSGLTKSQHDRAAAFLRGLLLNAFYGQTCDKPSSTTVFLQYGTQLFRQGKQLTASVKISGLSAICLGNRPITIESLVGNTNASYLYLNFFMLSHGLALADDDVDPKWPNEIRQAMGQGYAVRAGKESGLYLYGEKVDPGIEKILDYVSNASTLSQRPSESAAVTGTEGDKQEAKSSGSGFFVSKSVVLTNNHVVEGCSHILVSTSAGDSAVAEVRASDKGNDLAILKVGDDISAPGVLNFSGERPAQAGEPVTVAGYPLAGLLGSGVSITTGVISNTSGINNDTRFIQISAPVQPGNSGGPVLDHTGRLAGVVVSKLDALAVAQLTGDIPQNVNFAIKESVARVMLDSYGIEYAVAPAAVEVADLAAAAKAATVFIQCK